MLLIFFLQACFFSFFIFLLSFLSCLYVYSCQLACLQARVTDTDGLMPRAPWTATARGHHAPAEQ
jgi:hypothetical protein